jgi:hypothetical protein
LKAKEATHAHIHKLIEELSEALLYVADVHQFAKPGHLKLALDEYEPIVSDTTNFIRKYRAKSSNRKLLS